MVNIVSVITLVFGIFAGAILGAVGAIMYLRAASRRRWLRQHSLLHYSKQERIGVAAEDIPLGDAVYLGQDGRLRRT